MNLLLVEDDSEISQLLLRYLERQGFVVTHVSDGNVAVATFNAAAASATPFNVVLTDGLLPGRNGFQVAQAIRATPAGQRVGLAMMSAAFRGNRARSDALASGMDAYFSKPFVLAELRDSLATLARRHQEAGQRPTSSQSRPGSVDVHARGPGGFAGIERPATADVPAHSTVGPFAGVGRPPTNDLPRTTTMPMGGVGRPLSTDTQRATTTTATTPTTTTTTPVIPMAVSRTTTTPMTGVGARSGTGAFGGVGRLVVPARVDGMHEVARLLLNASRHRFDGVLRIVDGPRLLRLGLLNGVIVGAADNAPEHALGQWLLNQGRLTREQLAVLDERLKTGQERVAEALLALGFVTGTEALTLVEAQARARVRRSLGLRGDVSIDTNVDAAGAMAVGIIDVVEVILGVGLEAGQAPLALVFSRQQAREPLLRTPDFDTGLVAFARLRPMSTLPQKLLEGSLTVGDAAAVDASELFAMWLAGLVRVAGDPDPGPRSVTRAVKSNIGSGGTVDVAIVNRVSALLLRARGASIYRFLELSAASTSIEVHNALRALQAEVGREALSAARLGPATSAARELQAIIDEAIFVFADERRRRNYDEDIGALTS